MAKIKKCSRADLDNTVKGKIQVYMNWYLYDSSYCYQGKVRLYTEHMINNVKFKPKVCIHHNKKGSNWVQFLGEKMGSLYKK